MLQGSVLTQKTGFIDDYILMQQVIIPCVSECWDCFYLHFILLKIVSYHVTRFRS
jgi:hypothetical protein